MLSLAIGFTTLILWFMVNNHETIILYAGYIMGYTCVVLFQVSSRPS
jgi:hypothetical protein